MTACYPLPMTFFGVDVSGANRTALIPAGVDFVYVRAAFGTKPDPKAVAHVARARELGAVPGLYQFLVPSLPYQFHFDTFVRVAEDCGIGPGCLAPAIDVEPTDAAGKNKPNPSWCEPLFNLASRLEERFGKCIIYCNYYDWTLLGKPREILRYPLWVAHWRTTKGPPATPGGFQPTMWQYRVGPYAKGALHVKGQQLHTNAVDHDQCSALPLLVDVEKPSIPAPTIPDFVFNPALVLTEEDWLEMQRERDQLIEAEEP